MTGVVPIIRPNASAFGDVVKPAENLQLGRNRASNPSRRNDRILFQLL
jgi:hypothetical protein